MQVSKVATSRLTTEQLGDAHFTPLSHGAVFLTRAKHPLDNAKRELYVDVNVTLADGFGSNQVDKSHLAFREFALLSFGHTAVETTLHHVCACPVLAHDFFPSLSRFASAALRSAASRVSPRNGYPSSPEHCTITGVSLSSSHQISIESPDKGLPRRL